MLLMKLLVFSLGVLIVVWVMATAVRTFILPRGENAFLSRQVFRGLRVVFLLVARQARTFEQQDRILAYYSPVVLLALPFTYLFCVLIGFTCINWAIGVDSLYDALLLSGSSLLTLGFAPVHTMPMMIVSFIDSAIGLILVAVLIAYLPVIYSEFSSREKLVSMLDVNANTPPSPVEFILRVHRNRDDFDYMRGIFAQWEAWFVEVEETHTSLVALVFLRSQVPERNWLTAAGVVLDTAALVQSTIDTPNQIEASFCLRAGYLSLRRIATFFNIPYNASATREDDISITRVEYDEVYDRLLAAGVPLKPDREQAWLDYKGWRVNYDRPLLGIARIITAPYAMWVSDRAFPDMQGLMGL
jgi:hypothetical protein